MIHSNTGELNQLFSTFNRVWGAGGNASLNLKTVDGKVTALVGALLELQLGHPEDPRPGAKPEAEPVAAYQPHARRHRGPGRQARDNARRDAWRARRQETLPSPQATPPPPIEPLQRLITVVRNNRANNFSQLDGTTHHGVDNGEDTNRPPKPPYPEEPDGLEETDNQEPEETNETDASVGESYDAMWKRATEMCNGPILEMWGCVVCPDGPKIDKGEEESAICNLCKNNMELYEVS